VQSAHVGPIELHVAKRRLGQFLLRVAEPAQRLHESTDIANVVFGDPRSVDEFAGGITDVDVVDRRTESERRLGFVRCGHEDDAIRCQFHMLRFILAWLANLEMK
jgi:hypothetical protein